MSEPVAGETFCTRYRLPVTALRKRCGDGFVEPIVHGVFVLLTLLSPHHLLQCWSDAYGATVRYWVTDIYFVFWAALVLISLPWAADGGALPASLCLEILFVARLVEALSRELWIILFRDRKLTSQARVLVLALLNYATIVGLFGYLHADGRDGFKRAAFIALNFSAPDLRKMTLLDVVQASYCMLFMVLVFATFVARIRKDEEGEAHQG